MIATPGVDDVAPVGFGGFSVAEVERRRRAVETLMAEHGVDHLVLYGANRSGSAISWLTQWPVTREAHVLVTTGEPDVLLVSYFNHVPEAVRLAPQADVRFASDRPTELIGQLLDDRGAHHATVGLVGPLPHDQYAVLAAQRRVVNLGAAYVALRLQKSPEEVAALRSAAGLTDTAVAALLRQPVLGRTEHELVARIEHAYVLRGGGHHIHYLGVTGMDRPDRCVPAQWPTDRRVRAGDVMSFEISASVAPDYSGQLLRTAVVAAEPIHEVARMHEVAQHAFDAIAALLRPGVHVERLVEAAGLIEDAGYTTVDDVVHGFGGGYLPPVLGTRSRMLRPTPDLVLQAGMTLVVQPNVVRPDHRLGVQVGELLLVTDQGPQRLHSYPMGIQRVER